MCSLYGIGERGKAAALFVAEPSDLEGFDGGIGVCFTRDT
jgi:hypothetical protein